MSGVDTVTIKHRDKVVDLTSESGSGLLEKQLEFEFKKQYNAIALAEAVRGVKAITKELIRFGLDDKAVCGLMETIAIWKPIIIDAAGAIKEQLER